MNVQYLPINDPDTGEHLGDVEQRPCIACSGQGQRFGYACQPCGGSGRVVTGTRNP